MGLKCKKRFHIHKEQESFCLFIYIITSRVCFLLVASINAMLTPVSPFAHKNSVRIRKIQKTIKQSWVCADVIWPIHSFHVKNIKFQIVQICCWNLKKARYMYFAKIWIYFIWLNSSTHVKQAAPTFASWLRVQISAGNPVQISARNQLYGSL